MARASRLKKSPKTKAKKSKKPAKARPKKGAFEKDVPPDQQFVLCNGERLRSIKQLALAVDKLDDGVFYYHVTEWKNDFAAWVYDVFRDAKLAKALGAIKDKADMRKRIYSHFGEKY